MTMSANSGSPFFARAVIGIILYLDILKANFAGACRLAKAGLDRLWALILCAHGSVMKDIIFFLDLWFNIVKLVILLGPRCILDSQIGSYSCRLDIYTSHYLVFEYKSRIDSTLCNYWFMFLLLTQIVFFWDCVNAIISISAWNRKRCLPNYPSVPVCVHCIVVCLVSIQCAFLWIVPSSRYAFILQFAQIAHVFSLLRQFFSTLQYDPFSTFINDELLIIAFVAVFYSVYLNYVLANYLYKIATGYSSFEDQAARDGEYISATRSRHKMKDEDQETTQEDGSSSSRERSVTEEVQVDFIKQFEQDLKNIGETSVNVMHQVKGNRAKRQEVQAKFDETVAGIRRQLGGKSKKELAGNKSLRAADIARSEKKLVGIMRQIEGKSKKELAGVKSLLAGDIARSEKKLAGIVRQSEGKSKKELAGVKSLLAGDIARSEKKLAGIMRQIGGKSKRELADLKKLLEGNQANSEIAGVDTMSKLRLDLAKYHGELVDIRSLYTHELEALAGTNTLLTQTLESLARNNSLLRFNGNPRVQSMPFSTASNTQSNYSPRASNKIPMKQTFSCLMNTNCSSVQTQRSQPESMDEPSKSNPPDVDQAGNPVPCSEPTDNRNSRGIQTDTAVSSHSDTPKMKSENSLSKDSGSISEPSRQIRQSHIKSKTVNTNISNDQGHHSMQHDTKFDLNDSPVEEQREMDPACVQYKTKATSDNASNNAFSESTQSKVGNPTSTNDLSSPHSRSITTATTELCTPRIRNRLKISRSSLAPMLPCSPSVPITAHKSPSRPNPSTSRSPEIKQANHTGPFTEGKPRNSLETHSATGPDPSCAGSLQRDEEGPESVGSGPAGEPTDQKSQQHLDRETKDIGSSDSGCEPSVKQNSSPHPNRPSVMDGTMDNESSNFKGPDSNPELSNQVEQPKMKHETANANQSLNSNSDSSLSVNKPKNKEMVSNLYQSNTETESRSFPLHRPRSESNHVIPIREVNPGNLHSPLLEHIRFHFPFRSLQYFQNPFSPSGYYPSGYYVPSRTRHTTATPQGRAPRSMNSAPAAKAAPSVSQSQQSSLSPGTNMHAAHAAKTAIFASQSQQFPQSSNERLRYSASPFPPFTCHTAPQVRTPRPRARNREHNNAQNVIPHPLDKRPDLSSPSTASKTTPSICHPPECLTSQSELRQSPSTSRYTSTESVAEGQNQPNEPGSSKKSSHIKKLQNGISKVRDRIVPGKNISSGKKHP